MKAQRNEGGRRIRWAIITHWRRGGHAAADGLTCTCIYTNNWPYVYQITCWTKIDLRRTFSNVRRRVYGTVMWWPNRIPGGVP